MQLDRGYINIKEPIPIIVAAQGPKALEVAGEVGDGWVAPFCDTESFRRNFDVVRAAARRAGRPVDNFPATMFAAACVLRPGESLSSPRVMEWVGPISAVALHALWEASAVAANCRRACARIGKAIATSTSRSWTPRPTAATTRSTRATRFS